MGSSYNIPILYFSQLVGLTYGLSPKELGLDKLVVSADEIVRSRITVEVLALREDRAKAAEAEAKAAEKSKKAKGKEEDTKTEET